MDIRRNIDFDLEDFFSCSHSRALLIKGAKGVGKTYSIRKFCKTHFNSFIEINFKENPYLVSVFSNATDTKDFLLKLSLIASSPLEKGKTVIFFDCVEECPSLITRIKFLVDDKSYSYILSGEVYKIDSKDIASIPVGYLSTKEMYPLTFEEFIRANGVNEEVINTLKNNFNSHHPVDPYIHKKMMNYFHLYLIVGGMPSVVSSFLDTNNFQNVIEEQKKIVREYREEIEQKDQKNKKKMMDIFSLLPKELNAKNKRFFFKDIDKNLKFSRYINSFSYLKDARFTIDAFNVEEPIYPLKLQKIDNMFKLFSSDTGLLSSQYDDELHLNILNNETCINYGSLFENSVTQELSSNGFELYYFNNKREGELDFVIEYKENILPLIVKSGKDYERHNALQSVLSNPSYNIKEAIVLHDGNIKKEGKITYLPIYMTMFIEKEHIEDMIYKIDSSGLN